MYLRPNPGVANSFLTSGQKLIWPAKGLIDGLVYNQLFISFVIKTDISYL